GGAGCTRRGDPLLRARARARTALGRRALQSRQHARRAGAAARGGDAVARRDWRRAGGRGGLQQSWQRAARPRPLRRGGRVLPPRAGAAPDYADAHNNLGAMLATRGAVADAIAHYRHAIRLRPDFAAALDNLGLALARSGDSDAAVDCFRRALALAP